MVVLWSISVQSVKGGGCSEIDLAKLTYANITKISSSGLQ